jgi:hypothetical protein
MFRVNLFFIVLSLGACQSTWADYDQTLYATIATPSQEALDAHIATLESLVAIEPPPAGMCAELGYYLALSGRSDEMAYWFDRELSAYPQSESFIKQLRDTIEPRTAIQP